MKKLVIVHGDKGGVGKSTFSGLLADYFLQKFGHCVVVEGDRTIPDVAARYVEARGRKRSGTASPKNSQSFINSGEFER